MEELSKERQEQVATKFHQAEASAAARLQREGSITTKISRALGTMTPVMDEAHFEKPERVRIGRKGEYGRRLKVIQTSKGPREYHVTKGWRD
jgi:hypothetical protein